MSGGAEAVISSNRSLNGEGTSSWVLGLGRTRLQKYGGMGSSSAARGRTGGQLTLGSLLSIFQTHVREITMVSHLAGGG